MSILPYFGQYVIITKNGVTLDLIKNKKKVLVYFHTHWDREWYKTRVEFNFRLTKVIDDVLKKLKIGDLPCFYFDGQVSALEDYLKYRPENEKLIKKLIKDKKFFIGPFYCSTDSFLVSLQSFIANTDIGIEYSKKFGCNEFIGYCADTFGHSKSLPSIFNYYNFKGGIFWRGLGNLPQCFNWNGLKSVYLRQGYFHDYLNADLSYEKKAELIENQLKKIDDDTQKVLLLPLGADHLMVADNIQIQIKEINKSLKRYKLVISNPFEYLKQVKPTKKVKNELRDNSRNFILPGVLSSRIDLKIKNANSQWQLFRLAEPLNALCYDKGLLKNNYQSQIDNAKKELIKNHAHDSIYGCSTDDVHFAMQRRFQISDETSRTVINEVLNELSSDTDNINIINLSDYGYSGLCEIKTDKILDYGQLIKKEYYVDAKLSYDPNRIPVTEDFKNIYTYLIKTNNLKPYSISKLPIRKHKSDLLITDNSIENSKIAINIHYDNINLTDKVNNKVYKDFIEIIDFADVGDSYNYSPVKRNKKLRAEITGSRILTKGELRSVLQINMKMNIPVNSEKNSRSKIYAVHEIKLFVILDTEGNFVKFKVKFNNRAKNHILKVGFNFEKPITKTVSDDLLGVVERSFDLDYDISKLIPAPRGVELKTNTAPMQTFVETQGVAVITKGLNEYEIRKKALEITLLRSTGIISNPQNPSRGTPAGPPITTPDLYGLGENEREFAIIISDNKNKIIAAQQAFYGSQLAFFGNLKPQKLTDVKNIITADYHKKLKIRTVKNGKIEEVI